jgi:hypothetical protein
MRCSRLPRRPPGSSRSSITRIFAVIVSPGKRGCPSPGADHQLFGIGAPSFRVEGRRPRSVSPMAAHQVISREAPGRPPSNRSDLKQALSQRPRVGRRPGCSVRYSRRCAAAHSLPHVAPSQAMTMRSGAAYGRAGTHRRSERSRRRAACFAGKSPGHRLLRFQNYPRGWVRDGSPMKYSPHRGDPGHQEDLFDVQSGSVSHSE